MPSRQGVGACGEVSWGLMTAPAPAPATIADADLDASPEAVVWLFGPETNWPPECACCLGLAETTKSFDVSGGPGPTPYPVCALCRRHALGSDVIASVALLGALALVGGGYYALFGTAFLRRGMVLTGLLLLIAWLAIGFGLHMLLNRLLLVTRASCASSESPVSRLAEPLSESTERADHETERSHAQRLRCLEHLERTRSSGQPYLQLSFTNREYARRFVKAQSAS